MTPVNPHNAKAVNDALLTPAAEMSDAELTDVALQVLRDRYRPHAFTNSLFTVHDWVRAAEYALCPEAPDYDDLRYYIMEDERAEDGFYDAPVENFGLSHPDCGRGFRL